MWCLPAIEGANWQGVFLLTAGESGERCRASKTKKGRKKGRKTHHEGTMGFTKKKEKRQNYKDFHEKSGLLAFFLRESLCAFVVNSHFLCGLLRGGRIVHPIALLLTAPTLSEVSIREP
jgi:hypothetical protein